ncbi:uncharacterized protein BO96DRAFT_415642 [Aspergillus niger CBS 101883]|uniref:uncharacterized protein n=1 Tax=Aspergillus lacticoffeatus (strain CBS 101883) TaxID=1450533 RepID=UPI000D80003D|nr:uncharacterized protein BO96DRAFT_415642 [Aspergillus niger CBS 101883]PYH52363.1 hypothetical protein BO96DRAFT_415642 [Aspergillus niger CBS 101883]
MSAGITAIATLHSERLKRLSESQKLVAKYRDPLLLASMELQSRLYNILEQDFLSHYEKKDRRDLVDVYTAFLIGQFFSWTYILRRQVQFFRPSTDKSHQKLSRAIEAIQKSFSTDEYGKEDSDFMLWRGEQLAIGEIMTVSDGGELFCSQYSQFSQKFKSADASFREWFNLIIEGIAALVNRRSTHDSSQHLPASRLRRVQHSLLDLIDVLDPHCLATGTTRRQRVYPAPSCDCSECRRAAGSYGTDSGTS